MTEAHAAFRGSIPQNYDRFLGPAFFEPYALDLVRRLGATACNTVLEVACGTGILTRHLRTKLPEATRLVATDLNEAMFACAKPKFRPAENVEWKEADASALPLPDRSFEAVVCQFGLMFVPDKEAAIREAYRVLVSDGVLLFSVWDSIEHNPAAQLAHTTVATFFENDPPSFYETPFGFHDTALIRGLLQKAGFRQIEFDLVKLSCRSESAADFATGLVRGNPIAAAIEESGRVDIETVVRAVAKKIGENFGEKPVQSTMQALVWRAVR